MKTPAYFILLLLSTAAFAQQDRTITIISGGIERSFDVHLPAMNPSQNLPVLLCYHGSGGTSAGMAAISGFNTYADQNNFIAVYPQALFIGGDLQWNAYVNSEPGDAAISDPNAPDDIQFTHDIIDKLSFDYGIDRQRVYASGLSNGGFMCYALAMFAYKDIAAIAPVAGNHWGEDNTLQKIEADPAITPIPVMHIQGTADNVVDYPDPDNTPMPYQEWPLWFMARGCGATTYSDVVPIMNNVDKLVFCTAPTEVSLIRIKGMGHAWTNGEYPTSQEIVKFFNLQKSSASVATTEKQDGIAIRSSVADASLTIDLTIPSSMQLYNSVGVLVYEGHQASGSFEISTRNISSGIYILHIVTSTGDTFLEKVLVKH